MGQRIRTKKNKSTVKGVAIRRTRNKTGNNTVRVGNTTIKGGGKKNSNSKKKKKVAVRRKMT